MSLLYPEYMTFLSIFHIPGRDNLSVLGDISNKPMTQYILGLGFSTIPKNIICF